MGERVAYTQRIANLPTISKETGYPVEEIVRWIVDELVGGSDDDRP